MSSFEDTTFYENNNILDRAHFFILFLFFTAGHRVHCACPHDCRGQRCNHAKFMSSLTDFLMGQGTLMFLAVTTYNASCLIRIFSGFTQFSFYAGSNERPDQEPGGSDTSPTWLIVLPWRVASRIIRVC